VTIQTTTGSRIEQARNQLGLSLPQLARRIAVKSKTLENWENDRSGAEEYLATIRDYKPNKFTMAAEDIERVRSAWGEYATRWGYQVPETLDPAAADK